jgi:D-glycero-alpha-D-manno-heptose-7-phosphate kinase
MKEALLRGQIPRMADILNRSWQAKKRTASGISTGRIETLYDLAFANGAIGGKVSGAGGGGFMMFIVPPDRRIGVVRALNAAGGTAGGVHLTGQGAESWTI